MRGTLGFVAVLALVGIFTLMLFERVEIGGRGTRVAVESAPAVVLSAGTVREVSVPQARLQQVTCIGKGEVARLMSVRRELVEDGRFAGGQGTFLAPVSTGAFPWIEALHVQGNSVTAVWPGQFGTLWIKGEFRCGG